MDEAMATATTNTVQRQSAIRQQLSAVDLSMKDADTAFLIELIGGLLGFLGVGYLYSGLTNAGLLRLIGVWVAWGVFFVFAAVTLGLGACLSPVAWVGVAALSYFSAKDLKESLIAAKSAQAGAAPPAGPSGYLGAQHYEVPNSSVEVDERDPNRL